MNDYRDYPDRGRIPASPVPDFPILQPQGSFVPQYGVDIAPSPYADPLEEKRQHIKEISSPPVSIPPPTTEVSPRSDAIGVMEVLSKVGATPGIKAIGLAIGAFSKKSEKALENEYFNPVSMVRNTPGSVHDFMRGFGDLVLAHTPLISLARNKHHREHLDRLRRTTRDLVDEVIDFGKDLATRSSSTPVDHRRVEYEYPTMTAAAEESLIQKSVFEGGGIKPVLQHIENNPADLLAELAFTGTGLGAIGVAGKRVLDVAEDIADIATVARRTPESLYIQALDKQGDVIQGAGAYSSIGQGVSTRQGIVTASHLLDKNVGGLQVLSESGEVLSKVKRVINYNRNIDTVMLETSKKIRATTRIRRTPVDVSEGVALQHGSGLQFHGDVHGRVRDGGSEILLGTHKTERGYSGAPVLGVKDGYVINEYVGANLGLVGNQTIIGRVTKDSLSRLRGNQTLLEQIETFDFENVAKTEGLHARYDRGELQYESILDRTEDIGRVLTPAVVGLHSGGQPILAAEHIMETDHWKIAARQGYLSSEYSSHDNLFFSQGPHYRFVGEGPDGGRWGFLFDPRVLEEKYGAVPTSGRVTEILEAAANQQLGSELYEEVKNYFQGIHGQGYDVENAVGDLYGSFDYEGTVRKTVKGLGWNLQDVFEREMRKEWFAYEPEFIISGNVDLRDAIGRTLGARIEMITDETKGKLPNEWKYRRPLETEISDVIGMGSFAKSDSFGKFYPSGSLHSVQLHSGIQEPLFTDKRLFEKRFNLDHLSSDLINRWVDDDDIYFRYTRENLTENQFLNTRSLEYPGDYIDSVMEINNYENKLEFIDDLNRGLIEGLENYGYLGVESPLAHAGEGIYQYGVSAGSDIQTVLDYAGIGKHAPDVGYMWSFEGDYIETLFDGVMVEPLKVLGKYESKPFFDRLKLHSGILYPDDPLYPQGILESVKNPLPLNYRGRLSILDNPNRTAIIGKRGLTAIGKNRAANIGHRARNLDQVVVSGGAEGTDRIAQLAATRSGGKSITFWPHGFEQTGRDYVGKNFLEFSEYPYDRRFAGWQALRRNELITATSDSVIVVATDPLEEVGRRGKSGTYQTALGAIEQGKPVYVLDPEALGKDAPLGNIDLLKEKGTTPFRYLDDLNDLILKPQRSVLDLHSGRRDLTDESYNFIYSLYTNETGLGEIGKGIEKWIETSDRYFDSVDKKRNQFYRLVNPYEDSLTHKSWDSIALHLKNLRREGGLGNAPYELPIPSGDIEPLPGVFAFSHRQGFKELLGYGLGDLSENTHLRVLQGKRLRGTTPYQGILQPSEEIVDVKKVLFDKPLREILDLHSGSENLIFPYKPNETLKDFFSRVKDTEGIYVRAGHRLENTTKLHSLDSSQTRAFARWKEGIDPNEDLQYNPTTGQMYSKTGAIVEPTKPFPLGEGSYLGASVESTIFREYYENSVFRKGVYAATNYDDIGIYIQPFAQNLYDEGGDTVRVLTGREVQDRSFLSGTETVLFNPEVLYTFKGLDAYSAYSKDKVSDYLQLHSGSMLEELKERIDAHPNLFLRMDIPYRDPIDIKGAQDLDQSFRILDYKTNRLSDFKVSEDALIVNRLGPYGGIYRQQGQEDWVHTFGGTIQNEPQMGYEYKSVIRKDALYGRTKFKHLLKDHVDESLFGKIDEPIDDDYFRMSGDLEWGHGRELSLFYGTATPYGRQYIAFTEEVFLPHDYTLFTVPTNVPIGLSYDFSKGQYADFADVDFESLLRQIDALPKGTDSLATYEKYFNRDWRDQSRFATPVELHSGQLPTLALEHILSEEYWWEAMERGSLSAKRSKQHDELYFSQGAHYRSHGYGGDYGPRGFLFDPDVLVKKYDALPSEIRFSRMLHHPVFEQPIPELQNEIKEYFKRVYGREMESWDPYSVLRDDIRGTIEGLGWSVQEFFEKEFSLGVDAAEPELVVRSDVDLRDAYGITKGSNPYIITDSTLGKHPLEWQYRTPTDKEKVHLFGSGSFVARRWDTKLEQSVPKDVPEDFYSIRLDSGQIASASVYTGGLIKDIWNFKEKRLYPDQRWELSERFAAFMAEKMPADMKGRNYDLIVPVPSSIIAEQRRGFLPVEEIADDFGKLIDTEVLYGGVWNVSELEKGVKGMPYSERTKVKNPFRLFNSDEIVGLDLLLLDDVRTSGTTLYHLTRTLFEANPRSMDVYTLASVKRGHNKKLPGTYDEWIKENNYRKITPIDDIEWERIQRSLNNRELNKSLGIKSLGLHSGSSEDLKRGLNVNYMDPEYVSQGRYGKLGGIGLYEGNLRRALIDVKVPTYPQPYRDMLLTELRKHVTEERIPNYFTEKDYDLVIGVPSSLSRMGERGYNTSDLFAQYIGEELDIPFATGIVSRKETRRLAHVGGYEGRMEELSTAFEVPSHIFGKIQGLNLIVADDIITTSATMEGVQKTLLEAGARSVDGLGIARTLQGLKLQHPLSRFKDDAVIEYPYRLQLRDQDFKYEHLTRSQQSAVSHIEGPGLGIAVPGAGKTRVLVERAKRLGEHGVAPHNILNISFSKAAARELESRFDSDFVPGVRTMHSLAYEIVQENYESLGFDAPPRIDPELTKKRFKQYLKKRDDPALGLDVRQSEGIRLGALAKTDDEWIKAYEMYKGERGIATYRDYMRLATTALETLPDLAEKYRIKYPHVQIDEFQDLSEKDWRFLSQFGKRTEIGPNIFAVGDDDQAVYGFRGASGEVFRKFSETATIYKLQENFRTPTKIQGLASRYIEQNQNRLGTQAQAIRAGGDLRFYETTSENIFESVENYIEHLNDRENLAILLRSNLEIASFDRHLGDKIQGIDIGTIHKAKGKEWDHVILPVETVPVSFGGGIEKVYSKNPARMTPEEMAEEIRLFYVGMTRAKESLAIFGSGKRYNEIKRFDLHSGSFDYGFERKDFSLPSLRDLQKEAQDRNLYFRATHSQEDSFEQYSLDWAQTLRINKDLRLQGVEIPLRGEESALFPKWVYEKHKEDIDWRMTGDSHVKESWKEPGMYGVYRQGIYVADDLRTILDKGYWHPQRRYDIGGEELRIFSGQVLAGYDEGGKLLGDTFDLEPGEFVIRPERMFGMFDLEDLRDLRTEAPWEGDPRHIVHNMDDVGLEGLRLHTGGTKFNTIGATIPLAERLGVQMPTQEPMSFVSPSVNIDKELEEFEKEDLTKTTKEVVETQAEYQGLNDEEIGKIVERVFQEMNMKKNTSYSD